MTHEIATPTYQQVLEKQRREAEIALAPADEPTEVGQAVELTGSRLDAAIRSEFSRVLNRRVRERR